MWAVIIGTGITRYLTKQSHDTEVAIRFVSRLAQLKKNVCDLITFFLPSDFVTILNKHTNHTGRCAVRIVWSAPPTGCWWNYFISSLHTQTYINVKFYIFFLISVPIHKLSHKAIITNDLVYKFKNLFLIFQDNVQPMWTKIQQRCTVLNFISKTPHASWLLDFPFVRKMASVFFNIIYLFFYPNYSFLPGRPLNPDRTQKIEPRRGVQGRWTLAQIALGGVLVRVRPGSDADMRVCWG